MKAVDGLSTGGARPYRRRGDDRGWPGRVVGRAPADRRGPAGDGARTGRRTGRPGGRAADRRVLLRHRTDGADDAGTDRRGAVLGGRTVDRPVGAVAADARVPSELRR